jgi:RNA polymerase sigma-70 factor (ECF subfamily)
VPTEEWLNDIHERLLARDPVAPADLAANILDILIYKLSIKYYYLNDPDIIFDAASDAILSYTKNPKQFNPSKRGLLGYLQMAAEGDLKNALSKISRRQKREVISNDVELTLLGGNISLRRVFSQNEDVALDDKRKLKKAHSAMSTLFKDSKDLKMAELILKGERSTATFATVLGLQEMSIAEQKSEVKRHKDRIKKRLERYLKGRHEK